MSYLKKFFHIFQPLRFCIKQTCIYGLIKYTSCCNLRLGLVTKDRACKVASQERKPGSERKCEGMNLHAPKGASTLGVGVPIDFQMFREQL